MINLGVALSSKVQLSEDDIEKLVSVEVRQNYERSENRYMCVYNVKVSWAMLKILNEFLRGSLVSRSADRNGTSWEHQGESEENNGNRGMNDGPVKR